MTAEHSTVEISAKRFSSAGRSFPAPADIRRERHDVPDLGIPFAQPKMALILSVSVPRPNVRTPSVHHNRYGDLLER
jgi:hypothetical protein